jgi:hypothetical protein
VSKIRYSLSCGNDAGEVYTLAAWLWWFRGSRGAVTKASMRSEGLRRLSGFYQIRVLRLLDEDEQSKKRRQDQS